jgi:uncharacterized membrane protein YczE
MYTDNNSSLTQLGTVALALAAGVLTTLGLKAYKRHTDKIFREIDRQRQIAKPSHKPTNPSE